MSSSKDILHFTIWKYNHIPFQTSFKITVNFLCCKVPDSKHLNVCGSFHLGKDSSALPI